MLERFQRSVQRKEVDKVPVCSVTQTGTVELMKMTGTSWPKAFWDSREMAELAMAGYEIAGLECIRYPFCSLDIPSAFDCSYSEGTANSPPHQTDFPCKAPGDVKDVVIPDNFYESSGVRTMLEATDILRRKIDDKGYELPLIAGIIGPSSLAACIAGINNYLKWCIREPDALSELFKIGTEICTEYANVLYDHGADSVVIIDSESGPDLFPPPLFSKMVLPLYKEMTAKMKRDTILHMCGDSTDILDPIAESGFAGVSIEEKTDMAYASQAIGDKICLIGNISPSKTLLLQTPADVKREAEQCIEDGARILAPGCGIAPHTPLENIKAFVAARDEHYSRKKKL